MAGFSSTVEMSRLNMQFTMLSRELASVFKPAVDGAADALSGLVRGFRRLNGDQQDALMVGGLGVAGLMGANSLSRGMTGYGLGGLAMQGAAAASSVYDMYRAAKAPPLTAMPPMPPLAKTPGGSWMGDAAKTIGGSGVAGAAGAAMTGTLKPSTLMGIVGAGVLKAGAVTAGSAMYTAQAGDVVSRVRDFGNQSNLSRMRTVGEAMATPSPFAGMAIGGLKLADEGVKRAGRLFGLGDVGTLTGGFYESETEKAARLADEKKRRDVTPDMTGYSEIGGSFSRLEEASTRLDAGLDKKDNSSLFEDAAKAIIRLVDIFGTVEPPTKGQG